MSYLALGCRALLVLVFAAAVTGKARDPRGFVASVTGLRLLPSRWSPVVAAGAVAAEVGVVVALLLGRAGFAAATVLLLALTGVVAVAVARRTAGACRCFGRTGQPLGRRHVARNVVLLAVAVTGLLAGPPSAVHPGGIAVSVTAAVVAALLVVTMDDLVSLFGPQSGVPQ